MNPVFYWCVKVIIFLCVCRRAQQMAIHLAEMLVFARQIGQEVKPVFLQNLVHVCKFTYDI